MENIYNAIKNDIRSNINVASSILGHVTDWKSSQFIILSDIISDFLSNSQILKDERKISLGTTIAPITLQRFFENEYNIKTHNDLRFLKTLDKLCIFLGKYDLNAYIHDQVIEGKKTEVQKELTLRLFEKNLIFDYCKWNFDSFTYLPVVNTENIEDFVIVNAPLHTRTKLSMEEKKNKNLSLTTKNNRSNYEIFEVEKISEDDELIVIKTREFWNLLFMDDKENKFVINHLNTQFYFLRKFEKKWKIYDNFNPDYGKILKIN